MLKKIFNKKGFSLVAIILSLCISSFAFIAVVNAVQVSQNSINRKTIAIDRIQTLNNIKKIQAIIAQGYVTRNEKVSSGVSANGTSLTIRTTYFSRHYLNTDLYSIRYNASKKTVEERLGSGGDYFTLLTNIDSFSLTYQNKKGEDTTTLNDIATVKLVVTYSGNKKSSQKEVLTIKQFLNQNS